MLVNTVKDTWDIAVIECHPCVHTDHVVLKEGVLIAQARVARQAEDMVLPDEGGVVFGLNLRKQGRRLKAETMTGTQNSNATESFGVFVNCGKYIRLITFVPKNISDGNFE